jgi:hypothetical protein
MESETKINLRYVKISKEKYNIEKNIRRVTIFI